MNRIIIATLAVGAAFTSTMAHGQTTEVDIEVNLRDAQVSFVTACHNAGFESPSNYDDCVRAVPGSGADCTTTEACELYERWYRACQSTWAQILDRDANLTDAGFYAGVCGNYKP